MIGTLRRINALYAIEDVIRAERGRVGIPPTELMHLIQGTHTNHLERDLRADGPQKLEFLLERTGRQTRRYRAESHRDLSAPWN